MAGTTHQISAVAAVDIAPAYRGRELPAWQRVPLSIYEHMREEIWSLTGYKTGRINT